VLTEMPIKT